MWGDTTHSELPKIVKGLSLRSLLKTTFDTSCHREKTAEDVAKQAAAQLTCLLKQLRAVGRQLAKNSNEHMELKKRIKGTESAIDALEALAGDTPDAAAIIATYNTGANDAGLTDNAFDSTADGNTVTTETADQSTEVAAAISSNRELKHLLRKHGLERYLFHHGHRLIGVDGASDDDDDDESRSRVVQTSPLLPPLSDPINRVRGTRNADLVEGYVLNKKVIQHSAVPYFYAGESAVCSRRLPLVCLSRECPSWGMCSNNVVPFTEKNCSGPPVQPTGCRCIPTARIEDTLASVRHEGPKLNIWHMLFGFDLEWLTVGQAWDGGVPNGGSSEDDDGDGSSSSSVASAILVAIEKTYGSSPRKLLEANSQVFVPGVAGVFYTNLMQESGGGTPGFAKKNTATLSRAISNMVVKEIDPVTLPALEKMVLQKSIYESHPNYLVNTARKGRSAVVLEGFLEEVAQVAYNYNCESEGVRPYPTLDTTVSRTFQLVAQPHGGSGLPNADPACFTLVEGASAAVELSETIHVTLPIVHSLKELVESAPPTSDFDATDGTITDEELAATNYFESLRNRKGAIASYWTGAGEECPPFTDITGISTSSGSHS